jgi:pyruvate/2-oxoacid:ferredoxin oxidoreductase alpha subunit
MMKPSILAETDPDLAQAGAALERAARDARRLADQTNTPFIVFIDGKIVDLRKLEQESNIESKTTESNVIESKTPRR